jgi:double-stranded uracil-DNA glycosylase
MPKDSKPAWADLRLTDCIQPGVRLLLIGINPGVMSATTGHHFAGPTNRFWRLMYESGLVPEPVTHADDIRLPQWGIGMTNLVPRPTPGIDTLRPEEYLEGWKILEKKIERYRPEIVAFVGVTMYRALWKLLTQQPLAASKPKGGGGPVIKPGFQSATVHGARVFVLPNPSGRNAHFSYAAMLAAFSELAFAIRRLSAASSTESAEAAVGKSRPAAGRAARTTPSTPAAGRSRTAPRKRAGSRS